MSRLENRIPNISFQFSEQLVRHAWTLCYRPQRSWGKVIFLEACVKNSVHSGGGGGGGVRGRGACVRGGGICGRGMCMVGGCAWQGGMRGTHALPPGRYYEIRSMSGRYASYWNPFLFNYFPLVVGQKNTTQCSQRAGRRDECPVIINYQNEISISSASNSL